ncbi:hypothetical protein NVS89_22525 [Ancylobacter sp. MQZ15Z-1]|uniref:Uncharacterized protein n=1 Tax=Ancylobacter mangrovi TaxID=2972472 RepID=A0A9X2T3Z0_9HYPH|nr:hypothetical protein [Ancylobacter mangrovi]MCS0497870.1 hypothetical protein [Ancylobacter mangrovi]
MNLLQNVKVTRVANAAVAAQSDVNGSILDMAGYDGVMFVALLGDVTTGSVLALKAEQNTANAAGGMAELDGAASFTAGASDADSAVLLLDVHKPREQYVRAVLERGTANAVVDGILAIQYGAMSRPTVHAAGVIAGALLNDPNEA